MRAIVYSNTSFQSRPNLNNITNPSNSCKINNTVPKIKCSGIRSVLGVNRISTNNNENTCSEYLMIRLLRSFWSMAKDANNIDTARIIVAATY